MKTSIMKKLLIVLAPVLLLAATVGSYIYANKVIGIYSQQNFAVDGDFEKSTYSVSLSGGGSTAVAITSGGGIFGNALSITTPQNNDEVRIGINTTTGLGGLNCEARFNLKLFSTNTSPTIVDVDVISNAGTLSISNTQRVSLSVNNVWVPVSVNFPCSRPVAATFGRIKIIDAGVASSGTPIVYTDSFYAGEATNITNQVVVTDWQSYTPTISGFGSVSSIDFYSRRVGDTLEVSGKFTAGTVAASPAQVTLGFGGQNGNVTVDSAKIKNNFQVGTYGTNAASTAWFGSGSVLATAGANYLSFSPSSSTVSVLLGANGNIVSTTGSFVTFFASVPIAGWSATQSAITQQCIQDGSCENTFSAHVTSGGVVSSENIDWIQGNCTGGSPTTCTFKTNFFSVTPSCQVHTAFSGGYSTELFNTLSASQITVQFIGNNAGGLTVTCHRTGTDYKPRFAAPVLVGSVTSNSTSALRIESLSIETNCTSSPCTITRKSSNWFTSVTRSSTGVYGLTYPVGTFSAPPNCYCSSLAVGVTAANCAKNNLETLTSVGWATVNLAGALTDSSMSITCIGAR